MPGANSSLVAGGRPTGFRSYKQRCQPTNKADNSDLLPAPTVIDLHIETVRVQLPVNHVATSLESALSRFNSTINAFRTFDCD